jgi:hypothetical protein
MSRAIDTGIKAIELHHAVTAFLETDDPLQMLHAMAAVDTAKLELLKMIGPNGENEGQVADALTRETDRMSRAAAALRAKPGDAQGQ